MSSTVYLVRALLLPGRLLSLRAHRRVCRQCWFHSWQGAPAACMPTKNTQTAGSSHPSGEAGPQAR